MIDTERRKRNEQIVSRLLAWLEHEVQDYEHGEVGFVLVFHSGKIVRTEKINKANEIAK